MNKIDSFVFGVVVGSILTNLITLILVGLR
jgi:tetrahydromethanopterin S-methyltransferase subunit B